MAGTGKIGILKAGAAMFVAAVVLASIGQATALTVGLDQFLIYKNGSIYFNDTFDDGIVGNNPGGGLSPSNYLPTICSTCVGGHFLESGGKAILDGAYGAPIVPNTITEFNATIFTAGDNARLIRYTLGTDRTSNLANGLKLDDDIVVYGLFDVVAPTTRTTQYGIAFNDAAAPGNSNDNLRTGIAQSTLTGENFINVHRLTDNGGPAVVSDSSTDPNPANPFYQAGLELDTSNQQILFRMTTAANDPLVYSEFAYVNSPNFDATDAAAVSALNWTSVGARTAFNGEDYTRVEFRLLERHIEEINIAQLVTGSPVSIAQQVDTGASAFNLTFNYRFETPTGQLDIVLDGTVIGTFLAPSAVTSSYSTANILIDDLSLLGLTDVTLEFLLDGPTGSKLSLDAILFPGLLNGTFATRDLTNWTVTASPNGSAGVATFVSSVPEPATLALFGLGLVGLGMAARRRKARAAQILIALTCTGMVTTGAQAAPFFMGLGDLAGGTVVAIDHV